MDIYTNVILPRVLANLREECKKRKVDILTLDETIIKDSNDLHEFINPNIIDRVFEAEDEAAAEIENWKPRYTQLTEGFPFSSLNQPMRDDDDFKTEVDIFIDEMSQMLIAHGYLDKSDNFYKENNLPEPK